MPKYFVERVNGEKIYREASSNAVVEGPDSGSVVYGGSVGQELGYGERLINDTTTNNVTTDTALNANTIAGLTLSVIGTGRPVDVEFFCPSVSNNTANKTVFGIIMIDGKQASFGFVNATATASTGGTLVAKRRLVLEQGRTYTFNVAKAVATGGGTGTFSASATAPMYLSVVSR